MPREYYINEGNKIGGENTAVFGASQSRVKASANVTKGQLIEVTGDFTVGPAGDNSTKVCGIAFLDAKIGEEVTFDTEGFVKMDASSAAIVAGDKVVSAGNGKVKAMPAPILSDLTVDQLAIEATLGTPVELGDPSAQLSGWTITGATETNTANGALYGALTTDSETPANYTVTLYSDTARTVAVAAGTREGDGTITLEAVNDSGITGEVTVAFSGAFEFVMVFPKDYTVSATTDNAEVTLDMAQVESALLAINAKVGVAIAGCDADGVAFVKLTI